MLLNFIIPVSPEKEELYRIAGHQWFQSRTSGERLLVSLEDNAYRDYPQIRTFDRRDAHFYSADTVTLALYFRTGIFGLKTLRRHEFVYGNNIMTEMMRVLSGKKVTDANGNLDTNKLLLELKLLRPDGTVDTSRARRLFGDAVFDTAR